MKKKYVYLTLCVLWMAVIFWFSAQVADDSQGMSDSILALLGNVLHLDFMNGGWLEDTMSFLVRKAAHMSEYAILAILVGLFLREVKTSSWPPKALALCAVYAATDEFHQLFVPGRSGQLKDVGIDTMGALVGLCVLMLVCYACKRFQTKQKAKDA